MDIFVCILLFSGLFFLTAGSIGILRFPDFYSRLHPAGKLDTLGTLLALLGLALFTLQHFSLGDLLTSLKIMLIIIFVFVASPTATHAIVDAGVRAGLAPWTKGEKRR
ncbi:MAG: monovalent cation/H(+) antiporter subunit G [Thermodesulfobacteriota bacterium]